MFFIQYLTKRDLRIKKAIFGGGDSALDWALELSKKSNVTLIHRRNDFRGASAYS